MNAPARSIAVINRQRRRPVDADAIRLLARLVLDRVATDSDAGVNLMFVRDRVIRKMNRRFLDCDAPTDVISFPDDGRDDGDPVAPVGDVVISVDRALAYAKENGIAPDEELARYIVHGILHCLGYDDTEPEKKRIMDAQQETLVARWSESGRSVFADSRPASSSRKSRS